MTQFQQPYNRTFFCLGAVWITATLIACMPSVGAAQSGPPIFLQTDHYRDAPERWEAAVADASQCKGFTSANGMVVFAPNGRVKISVGYMDCFGTQTLKYSDGTSDTRFDVPWTTTLSCPRDQSIINSGEITTPRENFLYGQKIYSAATCQCRHLAYWNGSVCSYATSSVMLSGATETRPDGVGGIATVELTAKVIQSQNGNPKPGETLNFYVGVTPNSGGHEHHDINRPKGKLSAVQGTTDPNGEIKLTFTAPEVSGIHTVKATCATCSNSPAAKEIQVKVPDLVPISPNSPRNADGSLVYALTSVDTLHAGEGRYHKNQYYLTEQAQQNLFGLITSFAAAGWGTVALNDASLYWGGRYDIKGNWGGSHRGHRDGREIDISFTRASNPVSEAKQKTFYKKYCEEKAVEASFSILHHYVLNRHFHIYLEKQRTCHRMEE